jgi:hypothetical protein
MTEKETGWHHYPENLVKFEGASGVTRSVLLEPGMYPIVRHVLANFKSAEVKCIESVVQSKIGTSRRFNISSNYSFDLDFMKHEILSAVDIFIDHIMTGQNRFDASFNMQQDFTSENMNKRYSEFCLLNKERIRKEVLKAQ